MKKSFIALVAMLVCFAMDASAQFYVGGSVGYTSTTQSHGKVDKDGSSFKLMPEFGYQLDPEISVGMSIGYSHGYAAFGSLTVTDVKAAMNTVASTYADISEEDAKLNSFTFAPYVRYIFARLGKIDLFFEGSVGYINITSEADGSMLKGLGGAGARQTRTADEDADDDDKTKIDAVEIAFRPGLSMKLNDNISLIAKIGSVGYMTAKEKKTDNKISRFGLDLDSYNLIFGINVHF